MRFSIGLNSSICAMATCLAMLAPAAHAQDSAPQAADEADRDIVVTGSRVVRNGDAAPTPVTLVRTDELLKQQPTTLADGLNALPVFAGSRGPSTSVVTTGNAAGGNGAANQLNLRSLGSIRNLVLIDGQRLPTALFNGVVDVDIVPDMLIERVDVVTGGVSAVYGSDAISGVVNFITDRKFNGLRAVAQAGISERGDAPQYKLGIAGGTKIGDRGHFEASFTHFSSDPLFYRTDRPYGYDYAYGALKTPTSTFGAPGTVNNPYVLIAGGARNSSASFGGKITSGLYNNTTFSADGVLSAFNPGTVTASPNLSIGGDGFYNNASLGATQRSNQGFARFDYELTDDIKFHTQGIVSIKDNTAWSNYGQISNFTIRSTNPYLSDPMRAALATATQPYFTFAKVFDSQRLRNDVHTEQFYVNAGLDGKFSNFDWSLNGNYGRSTLHTKLSGNINNQHLAAAADAVRISPTQIVCGINADSITTNDDPSCRPLNLFNTNAADPAAMAYVFGETNMWSTNESFDINGNIGGELYDLFGAGAARFALSGQYRVNSMKQTVDYSSTDTANCSGLVINPVNDGTSLTYANNCVPVGAVQQTSAGAQALTPTALFVNAFAPLPKVTQKVKEIALEVAVPLLKDSFLGRSLEATGAVRYADYNTTGSSWVWKAGLNWEVFDDLRLRGTISRDFRAPTLNDLYQPLTITVANNADLLTGQSFLQSRTQGNPDLKPEVGHTWTLGAVYKPSFVPGLSIALDYYNIRITNAIQSVNGFAPSIQTACLASGGTSPFCALQPRPNGYTDTSSTNAPLYWITQNLNFAEITTRGVDADINYTTRLGGLPFNARVLVTYQPDIIYGEQPGASGTPVSFDAAGAASADGTVNNIAAKLRINGSIHIEPSENFSFDIRERWRSGYRYNPVTTTYFAQRVKSLAITDISATIKLTGDDRYQMFFNVQNLFDKAPPGFQTGILPGQGFVPGDDFIGRYFIAGVRLKM